MRVANTVWILLLFLKIDIFTFFYGLCLSSLISESLTPNSEPDITTIIFLHEKVTNRLYMVNGLYL